MTRAQTIHANVAPLIAIGGETRHQVNLCLALNRQALPHNLCSINFKAKRVGDPVEANVRTRAVARTPRELHAAVPPSRRHIDLRVTNMGQQYSQLRVNFMPSPYKAFLGSPEVSRPHPQLSTASHPHSEVKPGRAWIVQPWGTGLEVHVLRFFFLLGDYYFFFFFFFEEA